MGYYQGDYFMAGDYYAAGGLFSRFSFKKLFRFGSKAIGTVMKVAAPVASFIPGVGGVLGGVLGKLDSFKPVAQSVGRIATLLTPTAQPAGMPMDGAGPDARLYSRATQGGFSPRHLALLAHKQRMRHTVKTRGRQQFRRRGRRRF